MLSLSLPEARRIALAAQGFGARTRLRAPSDVAACVRRLGVVQIDSVNVLVRSHYLPLFSRHGPYDSTLLDRAAYAASQRLLFEYWGHEASFLPLENFPLFRWRMDRARAGEGVWGRLKRFATTHRAQVEAVVAQIRERGPLGAGELSDAKRGPGGWWGWSESKEIMEWLFWTGVVTTAQRRNFERLYDLTERVLPEEVVGAPPMARADAQRRLMTLAAQAMGVATLRDLRDYFRLPTAHAADRLRELLDSGELEQVTVEGWKQPAFLCAGLRKPRKLEACALLSPFDSLIWERQRTERLFDFHYRIEIYTPAHKRKHGYYVLPLLLGDRVVARVDLKSDRQNRTLQVRGGSVESHATVKQVIEPLRLQLQQMAEWLGLDGVKIVSRRGDLMRELKALVGPKSAEARKS